MAKVKSRMIAKDPKLTKKEQAKQLVDNGATNVLYSGKTKRFYIKQ